MTFRHRVSTRTRAAAAIGSLCLALVSAVAPAVAMPRLTAAESAPTLDALTAGQVNLKLVVGGLSSPIGVVNAGDGSGRLFIVQRGGTVRVIQNNALLAGTFMNIASKISSGGERGLLGLAFHPDFETNRRLFVFYTRASDGDLVIARYLADPGLAGVDETSEVILLVIDHPGHDNHNGGQLAFGPDEYLYIGTGDGGGGGDPDENAQDKASHLGKILRIDVDGTGQGPNNAYANPADNPFVGATGLDEIWAFGLRNPWRFSFDRSTDALWIGDVGQSAWEEVNREPGNSPGGVNYGWDTMEGAHCYNATSCNTAGLTPPIAEYNHSLGCSITGGFVYRGTTQLDLVGQYVLADFCSGRTWTIPATGSALTFQRTVDANISSFGESESGELYATDLNGGRLYRVVAPEFSDIVASPFLDDIHWAVYEGITSGCGGTKFCPAAAVTRGQMASFLARALNLSGAAPDAFTDDETNVHEVNINLVARENIASGCGGTNFCPNGLVTREQMASFLARALDLSGAAADAFTDDNLSIHQTNINLIAREGIATGCGGDHFCPGAAVTREQLAAFLHRAFN